jgi:hypothetical protein
MAATSFWRSKRRVIATLVAEQQTGWSWLIDLILKEQNLVRRRLLHVLWCRLRYDWRTFFQTALRPVRKTRYNIRSIIGTAGANLRTTGHYRPGLKPSTLAQLHQLLRPGDILLIRAEKKLTSAILPGFWAHAALFVGGPCELESLGAARHPYVSKHLADVGSQNKGLGCVIEAISPRVRIQPLHRTLFADHVLVIRPNLASEGIVGAICEAFGHVGKPYDFEFDFNVSTRIVCTELIYRCYHNHGSIAFPLTKRLGRYTLTGDDMARILLDAHFAASADSAEPFQAVALVLTTGADKIEFTPPGEIFETLRNIQAGWRPLNSTEAAHA